MNEQEKSLMYAMVTVMTRSSVSIKDTTLTKFTFKVNGSADAREFAKVLEQKFGVEDLYSMVTSRCQFRPNKIPLEDYGVFLDVNFGTELEQISSFKCWLKSVTFRHTVKNVGDGVEDTLDATLEVIKNEDDEDGRVGHYLKWKELNPQTGKKLLVPFKFEFWKADGNPIVYNTIDDEGQD